MPIALTADSNPVHESFEDGAARIIRLMMRLSELPEFMMGWRLGGDLAPETDDVEEFISTARQELGSEALESETYFLVAGTPVSAPQGRKETILSARFGRPNPYLTPEVRIEFSERHANIDFARRLTATLLDWDRIQHVSIVDPYYAMEDSPLDARRRGIGWAGWVPFQLTPEQVPEAVALEPLAGGTFLASAPRWAVSGAVPIAEAQALDLRLNSLGVLPTTDDLLTGNWANR